MLFRCTGPFLRRHIPACRADQPEIVPDGCPRSKSYADRRLGIMDPAVDFFVEPPLEERAGGAFFPIGINPVVDPVKMGQVSLYKACGGAIAPVRKADKHVREDVPSVACNPWYEVIDDSFLVPPPLFAAFSTLPAGLGHGTDLTPES
jgi:hypothetical protein